MHIGTGKVGNLQRTRPYVAGRNLWGALTERLARDTNSQDYVGVGNQVHAGLTFTYFYPTTAEDGTVDPWPWEDEARFRYLFLSSETATAINPSARSAEEGSLHEVECILPHTRQGEPVYLAGYVFQKEDFGLDWRSALDRLQIGGERGYGWGRVEVVGEARMIDDDQVDLFELGHVGYPGGPWVRVLLQAGAPVLAHALATPFDARPPVLDNTIEGPIEPLVGRETTPQGRFGVRLSAAQICYVPGAQVKAKTSVEIGRHGVWGGLT
jgi:hypothetical protein